MDHQVQGLKLFPPPTLAGIGGPMETPTKEEILDAIDALSDAVRFLMIYEQENAQRVLDWMRKVVEE